MFSLSPLPRTLAAAQRDMSHRRFEVRLSALRDLGRLLSEASGTERQAIVSTLTQALTTDEAPGIRADAAVSLADAGAREALPLLLTALEDAHVRVQEMALLALGELATGNEPRVLEALRARLTADAPALRFQALNAYFRVAPAQVPSVLLTALRDDDAELRVLALRILEALTQPPSAEALAPGLRPRAAVTLPAGLARELWQRAAELLTDGSARVRLVAALTLGQAATEERAASESSASSRVLIEALGARHFPGDADDEQFAIELVWRRRLQAALPALRRRAWGPFGVSSGSCAFQARVALARLGDARARRFILARLDAWSRDARNMAVVAAGAAALAEARPKLERLRAQPGRVDEESLVTALACIDQGASTG